MFARKFVRCGAACALFSAIAWAQPSLTTISDILFKADGTRFNGLAQFAWVTFESGNGSNIAQQSTTEHFQVPPTHVLRNPKPRENESKRGHSPEPP